MKITIDIPQADIPNKQGIIWVELHFIDGQVCECDYPFEVESEGEMAALDKPEACTDCKCGECRGCCTSEGKRGKGMTKDEYVIALTEVGVELSSTNKVHYEALAQAIGYADSLDRIRSEVTAYPAPLIPKKEVLNIIRSNRIKEN